MQLFSLKFIIILSLFLSRYVIKRPLNKSRNKQQAKVMNSEKWNSLE